MFVFAGGMGYGGSVCGRKVRAGDWTHEFIPPDGWSELDGDLDSRLGVYYRDCGDMFWCIKEHKWWFPNPEVNGRIERSFNPPVHP